MERGNPESFLIGDIKGNVKPLPAEIKSVLEENYRKWEEGIISAFNDIVKRRK